MQSPMQNPTVTIPTTITHNPDTCIQSKKQQQHASASLAAATAAVEQQHQHQPKDISSVLRLLQQAFKKRTI